MNQTINANLARCIQSTHSIGGDTYYDICANTSRWVPWGNADWISAIAATGLVLFMFAFLAVMGRVFYKMLQDF